MLNLTFKQYRVKFSDKIRPHADGDIGTSPIKQVNSGRLRPGNSSKLVFSEVQKHLSKSGGFLSFMKHSLLCFLLFIATSIFAQEEQALLDFEKRIEGAVVSTDIAFLKTAYADDFKFKHGTGNRSTKESWLSDVVNNKGKFISRNVDSSEAEIHGDMGITEGTITVTRADRSYTIHYVRAYRRKGSSWELFMHRTVEETHNN